jgi:predicted anti-sigma-YlaC factor YlaD
MIGPVDCGEIRHALGVYVVGAIDPAERAAVDAHLSHCPECREELAGLAGLPALLGRVPVADVERMMRGDDVLEEPPAELLDSLLAQVSVRRRARRWRTFAATAAAAVIAIGGGIAVGDAVVSNSGSSQHVTAPSAELATGSNAATGVNAAVYYTTSASGMSMKVQASGIAPGTHCQFWVNTKAGQNVLAGTWTVDAPSTWYHASSTYTAAQAKSFDISIGKHRVVTIPIS